MNSSQRDSLETKVLQTGILKQIGDKNIPTFPDYTEEIEKFIKNTGKKKKSLPFVNQEKVFKQVVRGLHSDYPYVVLIGEQGIGKSMILDYIVDVLTGKVSDKEVEEIAPETAELFKDIKAKARLSENRDYLLVPNLEDPMKVKSIAYLDRETLSSDLIMAEEFGEELSGYLDSFIEINMDDLKLLMEKRQFRKFVHTEIHSLYTHIYNTLTGELEVKRSHMPISDIESLDATISMITLDLPANNKSLVPDATWELYVKPGERFRPELYRDLAGFSAKRKNLTKKDIEEGLINTFIPDNLVEEFKIFKRKIRQIEVKGETPEFNEQVLEEEFERYKTKILNPLNKQFKKNKLKIQREYSSELSMKVNHFFATKRISDNSIEEVISTIEEIKDENIKYMAHPDMKQWANSIYEFFNRERDLLRTSIELMLDVYEDLEENKRYTTEGPKSKEEERAELKKFANKNYEMEFQLQHGRHNMPISKILDVNDLSSHTSPVEGISWSKVLMTDREKLFCDFFSHDEETPPHQTVNELGDLFASSILLFTDSFGDFVETITSNKGDQKGMREQFLDYLQTGVITLVNDGITYQFEVPRMIIGCDNEDPFVTIRGGSSVYLRDEEGLRGRVHSINVPTLVRNSPKTREGTIEVMYKTLDQFNEHRDSKLNLEPAAANMLLQTMIYSENLATVTYREFIQSIEDICSFAVSKKSESITPDLLKLKTKENLHPTFFSGIERETHYGGFFDLDEKIIGHTNGLSIYSHGPAGIVKNRSYFVPALDSKKSQVDHFQLIDINSEMTDETTIKGYELAVDYLRTLLSTKAKFPLMDSGDWFLKTQYGDNWSGIGGPSASMAITLSMFSALSETEMYKNRFITGTIDPMGGDVGMIGGTYFKGLVPWKISEMLEERGEENYQTYFLFPAGNLKDLTQDSLFDPFGLHERVTCIPYENFAQAYHLFSCGSTITDNDMKHAEKLGHERIQENLKAIETKFRA